MNGIPDSVCLEQISCPNGCKLQDDLVLTGHDRLHGLPGEFTIYRCTTCGLQRTTPRPTAETMGFYYPADYAPYHPSPEVEPVKISRLRGGLRRLLRMDTRVLPPVPVGRMLEVGCSSGAYMEQMRRIGWHVDGIEFSEEAAATARSKGFVVQTGRLEDALPPPNKYDVIAAWMVLEHLHDPVPALAKLREWTKPDGYLVAVVPDAQSIAKTLFKERCYDLQLPTHLFHFTPVTLKTLLVKSGWELERVFWQRDCNTLLWSFEYWAREERPTFVKLARWLRLSNRASKLRAVLGIVLGALRQSGRIEVWARPVVVQ